MDSCWHHAKWVFNQLTRHCTAAHVGTVALVMHFARLYGPKWSLGCWFTQVLKTDEHKWLRLGFDAFSACGFVLINWLFTTHLNYTGWAVVFGYGRYIRGSLITKNNNKLSRYRGTRLWRGIYRRSRNLVSLFVRWRFGIKLLSSTGKSQQLKHTSLNFALAGSG